MRNSENSSFWNPQRFAMAVVATVVIVLIFLFTVAPSIFGYWFVNIDSTEVGVLTKFGKFVEVLGPGQYTDVFNFGADINEISVTGLQFSVTDPEVALTGDTNNIQQTIGVVVGGTVFRPGLTPRGNGDKQIPALSEDLWRDNRPLYINDDVLKAKIDELTKQAMKVCVGPRTLAAATVGSQRNDLAVCIDQELTDLAGAFALDIKSVTVPDVILPDEIKASIKQISQANQDAQLAQSNATLAYAQGLQQQAEILANAQVTAVAQNFSYQAQSTQAAAKEQSIIAAGNVQAAQATNDAALLSYQKAQAQLKLEIAQLNAQSETAQTLALAKLYQDNPQYAAVIIQTAFAEGLKSVSKVFYIPADTKSLNVIGGVNGTLVNQDGNMVPVIPLGAAATPVPATSP